VARWQRDFTRNTAYSRRSALKKVLRWYEHTTGLRGLVEAVPRVKGPTQRHVVARPDELDALHRVAGPFERIWLRISVALALRQSDVRRLSAEHYDAESKTVSLIQTKTGEPIKLPVPDDLAAIFEAAPDFGDPAMPFLQRYNRTRPVTPSAISCRWSRMKRLAGVRPEVTPHDLRRTTATATYEVSNHDLRVVQQLLGHQSMRPTVAYLAQHDPAALRPLLAQLWKPVTEVEQ